MTLDNVSKVRMLTRFQIDVTGLLLLFMVGVLPRVVRGCLL